MSTNLTINISDGVKIDLSRENLAIIGRAASGKTRTLNVIKQAVETDPLVQAIYAQNNVDSILRAAEKTIQGRVLREGAEGFQVTEAEPHILLLLDGLDLVHERADAKRRMYNKLLNIAAIGCHAGVTIVATGDHSFELESQAGRYFTRRLELTDMYIQDQAPAILDYRHLVYVQLEAPAAIAA